MRRPLTLLLVSVLAFSACGGDDDDADATGTTTSSTARATTSTRAGGSTTTTAAATTTSSAPDVPTTAAGCDAIPGPEGDPLTGGDPAASGVLRNVAVTTGDCLDRVAFEFGGALPGYRVAYEPGPFSEDGSGAPVAVAGDAFVVVRFEPAYGFDFETGEISYTGPREIVRDDTAFVREIEKTGDFEAVITWVVGVERPVRIAAEASGTTLTLTFG